jgi:hypothetical protein
MPVTVRESFQRVGEDPESRISFGAPPVGWIPLMLNLRYTGHNQNQHHLAPRLLSTPLHKYHNVCGRVLRGEVEERGGVDASFVSPFLYLDSPQVWPMEIDLQELQDWVGSELRQVEKRIAVLRKQWAQVEAGPLPSRMTWGLMCGLIAFVLLSSVRQ